jgi:hypothetical protein
MRDRIEDFHSPPIDTIDILNSGEKEKPGSTPGFRFSVHLLREHSI